MPFKKPADYLRDAELCRRKAEAAPEEDERTSWLKLAEGWEHLARMASRRVSPGDRPTGL
jgi:hypothetical protein